jgi:hypothetical protein
MFLDTFHHPVLDKRRTRDKVQKYNICNKNTQQPLWKCSKVQVFVDDIIKLKFQ